MKKGKLFKSTIISTIASLICSGNIASGVWMPSGALHDYLYGEACKAVREDIGIGYSIDSVACAGIDVSSYNPEVAKYWSDLVGLCKGGRCKSTPIYNEDFVAYWSSVAKYYGAKDGIDITSKDEEAAKFRTLFLDIYNSRNGFKADIDKKILEKDWLSLDTDTRIKIAKIYIVSVYLNMISIGMSKNLLSDVDRWNSYDDLKSYIFKNKNLKIIFIKHNSGEVSPRRHLAISKVKEVISWPK